MTSRIAFYSGTLVGLALGGFAGGLIAVPAVALLFAWVVWRYGHQFPASRPKEER